MADIRGRLERLLDDESLVSEEKLGKLVDEAFSYSRTRRVWHTFTCRSCSQKQRLEVEVEVPDWPARKQVVAMLIDQAKGKPSETRKVEASVAVSRVEELEGLSDEELARLAAG